jgi:hypothetical protein
LHDSLLIRRRIVEFFNTRIKIRFVEADVIEVLQGDFDNFAVFDKKFCERIPVNNWQNLSGKQINYTAVAMKVCGKEFGLNHVTPINCVGH